MCKLRSDIASSKERLTKEKKRPMVVTKCEALYFMGPHLDDMTFRVYPSAGTKSFRIYR